MILIYQGLEEENLDQKLPGPPGWGLMQRASSSLITKKQKMLKKPNTKPRKGDRDRRAKLRNRTLKFGTWNVQDCRNKMEEILREISTHLEEDQWLNRKEWCLGSGRRRQPSQDRKDRER